MQLVFSNQPLPCSVVKTIFLAGPSPRFGMDEDWRHEAVKQLQLLGYDGHVLVPSPDFRFHGPADGSGAEWSYDNQITWEVEARAMADVIVFWVPRVIDTSKPGLGMPGFTTNFELGEDLSTGKVVYGRPNDAVKCTYLDSRVRSAGGQVHDDLGTVLKAALKQLGVGAERRNGEAQVPLHIWRHEGFQSWYANLKAAGNRLDAARAVACIFAGSGHLFSFVLKVKVWVQAEQRHKSNEVILSRKDVSAVLAFCRGADGVELALVREFRSPVNNSTGFVFELAGGSSAAAGVDPQVAAQEELHEEMGLFIEDASRFRFIGKRQLAATFSTHQASVFAIELTPQEFEKLRQLAIGNAMFGAGDSEQTYIHVSRLRDLSGQPVDYSTLGMVFEAASQLQLT